MFLFSTTQRNLGSSLGRGQARGLGRSPLLGSRLLGLRPGGLGHLGRVRDEALQAPDVRAKLEPAGMPIMGTTPEVDTVRRRREMPYP